MNILTNKNLVQKSHKIAFVSDAIWPYNKGGKEKRLFDISTRLAQKGYEVHIYTMKWWLGPTVIKENGVTLHAISRLYPLYSKNRRSIRQGVVFGLSCFQLLTQDWDVIDVDHIPFFPLFPIKLICLLKNKIMIATWHEVWGRKYWKNYLGYFGNLAFIIERLSVLMPDKIISVSVHTTKKLRSDLFPRTEILTIPDGIDFASIQKVKLSPTKSNVIFAGRLLSHKNVDILIKSITILKDKIPNIKCLIIGDGPEKKLLEDQVTALNLTKNITFLGFLENHNQVISLMKSSNVFVLPSTREGFGIVVLEAFACGIPVITTSHQDNAANGLIKNHKNGIICQLDEQAIAQAIAKIIKARPNNQDNFKTAESYDWNHLLKKFETIYNL